MVDSNTVTPLTPPRRIFYTRLFSSRKIVTLVDFLSLYIVPLVIPCAPILEFVLLYIDDGCKRVCTSSLNDQNGSLAHI